MSSMSSNQLPTKLMAIAVVPAAFVAAFVAAFLVMGAADAFAQPGAEAPTPTETGDAADLPADPPPYRHAPPSDELPPDDPNAPHAVDPTVGHAPEVHAAGGGHGKAAHGGGHGDPSKHFNWFGSPFGYKGKDIAGGKLGDGQNIDPRTGEVVGHGEEAMSAPFFLMILNFLILVVLLAWKGGPIVRKLAADRHDQIKDALDEAAKLRKQAADKLAEFDTKLKTADAEIATMVEGMRKDAEVDKARILENAANQAAQMKRDAEQRIAAEIQLARAALTREVTAAATAATEQLLRTKMMPTDQQKLVATFITDVQAQPTGGPAGKGAV